jgi:hypothetical protein
MDTDGHGFGPRRRGRRFGKIHRSKRKGRSGNGFQPLFPLFSSVENFTADAFKKLLDVKFPPHAAIMAKAVASRIQGKD